MASTTIATDESVASLRTQTSSPPTPATTGLQQETAASQVPAAAAEATQQEARQRHDDAGATQRPLHVLLATTGSVASVKLPLIAAKLSSYRNVEVQVVATEESLHFYAPKDVESKGDTPILIWRDQDEWADFKVGDPILHIELRRWADIVLVCPCSANALAKISNGICDNLLTSLLRATDTSRTPVILFPAMNTFMYEHPLTAKQLKIVKEEIGYEIVGPVSKGLACGDDGIGAMTEWTDIVKLVVERYSLQES